MTLPEDCGSDGPLAVREWRVGEAAALAGAVAASRQHLAPWMEWAGGPTPEAAVYAERIANWHARRVAGGDALYGMFLDGRPAGACGLHGRLGPGGLEIGYWVHVDFTRRGLAGAAARLLAAVAFADPDIDRVEIHHDAANVASGAVPRRLGYALVGESRRPRSAPADSGIERRWRLTRERWMADPGLPTLWVNGSG